MWLQILIFKVKQSLLIPSSHSLLATKLFLTSLDSECRIIYWYSSFFSFISSSPTFYLEGFASLKCYKSTQDHKWAILYIFHLSKQHLNTLAILFEFAWATHILNFYSLYIRLQNETANGERKVPLFLSQKFKRSL